MQYEAEYSQPPGGVLAATDGRAPQVKMGEILDFQGRGVVTWVLVQPVFGKARG
jgi:hypothetical protein